MGGVILAVVFLIRGVIMPIANRVKGGGSEEPSVVTEEQVAKEEALADPDAAVRIPLKGVSDADKLGYVLPGWHEDDNGRWYQNSDGSYYSGGFQVVDGTQYYFDDTGYAVTGWLTKGVKDYYFDDTGAYDPSITRPMLALTFDDGPGQYTERLLNCLEENGAHATFFMLGELIPSYPEEVQHMLRIGCELGNHSYDHSQLTNLSLDDVAGQFSRTDDALIQACGQPASVCRAPYGAFNQSIIETGNRPFFMWSLDSLDWSYKDVDLDYQEIMEKGDLSDGTIILMHDIHEPSVECACRIIPELIDRGYKLVTVSEMAEAKDVELQVASYSDFWDSSLAAGLVPGYRGSTSPTASGSGSTEEGSGDGGSSDSEESYDEESYDEGSYDEESYDEESYDYEEESY